MKEESFNHSVFESARDLGMLFPCNESINCLRLEVNAANSILWVLWKFGGDAQSGDDGLTTDQIARQVQMSPIICQSYLNRLAILNFVGGHYFEENWVKTQWYFRGHAIWMTTKKIDFESFLATPGVKDWIEDFGMKSAVFNSGLI